MNQSTITSNWGCPKTSSLTQSISWTSAKYRVPIFNQVRLKLSFGHPSILNSNTEFNPRSDVRTRVLSMFLFSDYVCFLALCVEYVSLLMLQMEMLWCIKNVRLYPTVKYIIVSDRSLFVYIRLHLAGKRLQPWRHKLQKQEVH